MVTDHGHAAEVLPSCTASLAGDAAEPAVNLLTRCLEVVRRWTRCGWANNGAAAPRLDCLGCNPGVPSCECDGEEILRAKALTRKQVDMTAAPHGGIPPLGASHRSSNPLARISLDENSVQFLDE